MSSIEAAQTRPKTPLTASAHRSDLSNLTSTMYLLGVVPRSADTSNAPRVTCAGCGSKLLQKTLAATG